MQEKIITQAKGFLSRINAVEGAAVVGSVAYGLEKLE